ncbi:hypothetical protein EAI_01474, partial [Harpegnathos saltator]
QRRGFTLGWSAVRTEMLAARPPQCFKCWGLGHARAGCSASINRSSLCFRCGRERHTVQMCNASPHCVVCEERGRAANLRMAGSACGMVERQAGGDGGRNRRRRERQ